MTLAEADSAIHSGHFMVSCISDESNLDADVESNQQPFNFQNARLQLSQTYSFGSQSTNMLVIDSSLTKLFNCMTLAYRGKLVSPKWKHFRGIDVKLQDKIRLNNLIWREWHMQFKQKQKPIICHFETPIADRTHARPEAVVLEGKYWKRRFQFCTTEYRKWRQFYKEHFLRRPENDSDGLRVEPAEVLMSIDDKSGSVVYDRREHLSVGKNHSTGNFMMDFSDTLFSTLAQPFAFPDAKEISTPGFTDIIQPGLIQLQPSFDNFMDVVEPLSTLVGNGGRASRTTRNLNSNSQRHQFKPPLPGDLPTTTQQQPISQTKCPTMQPSALVSTRERPCQPSHNSPGIRAAAYPHGIPSMNAQSWSSTSQKKTASTGGPKIKVRILPAVTTGSELDNQQKMVSSLLKVGVNTEQKDPTGNLPAVEMVIVDRGVKMPSPERIVHTGPLLPNSESSGKSFAQVNVPGIDSTSSVKQPCQFTVLPVSETYSRSRKSSLDIQPPCINSAQSKDESSNGNQSDVLPSPEMGASAPRRKRSAIMTILTEPDGDLNVGERRVSTDSSSEQSVQPLAPRTRVSGHRTRKSPVETLLIEPSLSDFQKSILISAANQVVGMQHENAECGSYLFSDLPANTAFTTPRSTSVNKKQITNCEERRSSDYRRSCSIKRGFETLNRIIPSLKMSSEQGRINKVVTLFKVSEYCRQLREENELMLEECRELQKNVIALQQQISDYQSQLPPSGAPLVNSAVPYQMDKLYESYIYVRTLANWKFWIFSLVIKPLFEAYHSAVMSAHSRDVLHRCVLSWLQRHCSLVSLRPVVLRSLRVLSTTTSILTDPSAVPQEAVDAVSKPSE